MSIVQDVEYIEGRKTHIYNFTPLSLKEDKDFIQTGNYMRM